MVRVPAFAVRPAIGEFPAFTKRLQGEQGKLLVFLRGAIFETVAFIVKIAGVLGENNVVEREW